MTTTAILFFLQFHCILKCSADIRRVVQVLYNPSHNDYIGSNMTYYAIGTISSFGYNLAINPPVAGAVAIGEPLNGCNPITNSNETSGKIVIVYRGDCTFGTKADNVQKSGGIGTVIIDKAEGISYYNNSGPGALGGGVDGVIIPTVLIFNIEGTAILSLLRSDPDIYLYLGLEPVDKGTSCGPAPNVTSKNAVKQYTVTEDGVTVAYVCNDGFLWSDGAIMKQDYCDNGTWVPRQNSNTVWGKGCVEVKNDQCDQNPCPADTVCQYSGISTSCLCPQSLTQPYYRHLLSEQLPLSTDDDRSSCEVISNGDRHQSRIIDDAAIAVKNCPFRSLVNMTLKFENISNCNFLESDLTLYTFNSTKSISGCNSKSVSQCKVAYDRSVPNKQSCNVMCPCDELQCEFIFVLKPNVQVTICEMSLET